MVSVYAVDQQLSLGQMNAAGVGEIETIRKLIDLITLDEAAVVTIDAIGCQRDIADKIIQNDADYVLSVKKNQPTLHAAVSKLIDEMVLEKDPSLSHAQTTDGNHDRIEIRRVWTTDQVQHLGADLLDAWPSVASIAMVESTRDTGGKVTTHRRYFISSLEKPDARRMTGVAVAADGSVLVCGTSGPNMWTSLNAPVAWPAEQESGGQACLVMLSPGLDAM